MSDRYHNQVRLACNEIVVGFIPKGGVHEVELHQQTLPDGTPNPYYLRMLVDVQALDGRGQWNGVPIQQQAGVARHYREGQVVLLAFRHFNNLLPIVIGHAVNTDGSITVANPLVLPMVDGAPDWQIDDQAYVHPETGAFIRFRNISDTPGRSLAPSAPDPVRLGKFEVTLTLGGSISIEDTPSGMMAGLGDVTPEVGALIKMTAPTEAGAFTHALDSINQKIESLTPNGLKTIASDATAEISHVAPNIGLGAVTADLSAAEAAFNKTHITDFENNLWNTRLNDLQKFAAAMVAANVPNAGAVIGQLATLLHVSIPDGSSVVKLVS